MEKIEKQRLEQLVRLGIIPSNKLPILIQGLDSLSMGKQLLPNEREVISKYMDNLTSIMLNDTNVFNQAKLRTQKLKYQAEEITVNNGVKIFDNPEEEEQQRKQTERKLKVRASDKKERFKLLPAAVKREKRKAGVYEDLLTINNTYQAVFEAALELYGVTNIRDLPEDKKAEFFIVVDSASSDDDLTDIEEDMKVKQAIGIASDKRYKKGNMTGAVNAIEKLKPGLADHPQVKAVLKRQNENVESDLSDVEQLDEKSVPTSPEKWAQAKAQTKAKFDVYPSAYANGWAAKKYKEMGGSWKSMKEEVDQIDELSTPTLSSYVKKVGAEDKFTKKRVDGLNLALNKIKSNSTKKEEVELDEAMSVYDKSKAHEVHKVLKSGDSVGQAYGLKIKAMHNQLKQKYGSAWRKKAGINEEVEQIDELKMGTLVRYATKAGKSGLSAGIEAARKSDMGDSEGAAASRQKSEKRYAGQSQAIRKINTRMKSGVNVGEEVELEEGRPSQRHPLEGHEYHKKSNAELVGIAKDAREAAEAMKSHNTTAENKYMDQANDSATVRHFRKTSGMPDWYKKKYGLKEEVEHIDEEDTGYQDRYAVKNGKAVKDNPKMSGDKKQPYHVYADSPEDAVRKHTMKKEEVETVNELVGNQHKIDANKNGKVDAHDFKLLRSKKKQPQGADFAAQRRKERLASSGRMDERYEDDDYGSMSKKEFKRREMEHELGHEDGTKRKSSYSKYKAKPYSTATPAYSGFKKEEVELTFEEMTPAQKAERLRMIARSADRVQSGAAEKSVKKLAKKDMKSPGAQRGMAPLKKDVDEQIQILRKTIVEGTTREKIFAYKELNNLIQEKLKGEE